MQLKTLPEAPGFDTSKFLQFLFSTLFLSVCALILIMYQHKLFSFAVQTVLRYCFLPSTSRVYLGGLLWSPPGCRIFFQDFFYQDENVTLRITDGYLSFTFWDSLLGDPSWTTVRDFMMNDNLRGMQCLAKVKMKWVRGVIVGVEKSKRRLLVRLENGETSEKVFHPPQEVDDDGFSAFNWGAQEMADLDATQHSATGNNGDKSYSRRTSDNMEQSRESHRTVPTRPREMNVSCGSIPSTSARMFYSPDYNEGDNKTKITNAEVNFSNVSAVHLDEEAAPEGGQSDTVRHVDMSMVCIQKKRGKIHVHFNGMGLTLYNAAGNYRKHETAEKSGPQKKTPEDNSILNNLRSIFRPLHTDDDDCSIPRRSPGQGGVQQPGGWDGEEEMSSRTGDSSEEAFNAERTRAAMEQHRQKNEKSIMQRFYDFIGAVEVELFTSYINVGGAGAQHPYFLHFGFKRAEGISYLTREGVPSIDLYRLVAEATLEELTVRWFPMKGEENTREPKSVWDKWRDSFLLSCGEVPPDQKPDPLVDEPSVLIKDYGTIIDNKEESSVHFVCYRDFPNVYAGEEIVSQSDLPTSGIELFVDTPNFCHGPWSNFSIMQLKEYFVPNTYQSVESLKFELGKKRPHGSFEIYVELLRETSLIIPFKRKTVAPNPPFGLLDSGRKGMVAATLGRGSSYVQKFKNLLPHEEKQCMESLLTGLDVLVATNAIQEESAVFMRMDKVEFYVDKLSDKPYNGRKLWNILPVMEDAEVWWHMDYIGFFGDLCLDWQFVPYTYHGISLTTEEYNTYKLFVEEFIPTVKRFECIFAGSSKIHFNGNMHNVIYSENINDETANVFLTVRTKSNGHMFLTAPSDAYLLSSVTEVRRPFEVAVTDMDLLLSVPQSHPLHELVDCANPFGSIGRLFVKGLYTVNVPNQAVPQGKDLSNSDTQESKLTNCLDYEIYVTGVRGYMSAPHITTFRELFENLFGDSSCVVRPDELFWPLSKIHPKINTPKNVRSAFHQYLQKDEPLTNSLDFNTTVSVTDVDVTLRAGGAKSPQMNVRFGTLNTTIMKQSNVTDMSLTVSPTCGRFLEPLTGNLVDSTFLCCGDVSLSVMRHFGPPPVRVLFYSATECAVNGISFHMTVEQVALLTELFTTLRTQFFVRDEGLLEEIEKARTVAAYSADNCVLTSRLHMGKRRVSTNGRPPPCCRRPRASSLLPRIPSQENERCKAVRLELLHFLTHGGPFVKVPFSELVPSVVARGFQQFLEQLDQAEDHGKDYAIRTVLASTPFVKGCVAVGRDSYLEVKLPTGVRLVSTTKNDLNSNLRATAVFRDVALYGYCRKSAPSQSAAFSEVFRLEASLQVRRSVAYPFDKGLEIHRKKQQHFIFENDVHRLFTSPFVRVQRAWMPAESFPGPKGGTDDPQSSFLAREEEEGDEKDLWSTRMLHRLPVYNQGEKSAGNSVDEYKGERQQEEITLQGVRESPVPPCAVPGCSNEEVEHSAENISTLTTTLKCVPADGTSLDASNRSDETGANKSATMAFATCMSPTDEAFSYTDEEDLIKEMCEGDDVLECGFCSVSRTPDDELYMRVGCLPGDCENLATNSLDCVSSMSASPQRSDGNTGAGREPITSTHFLRQFVLNLPGPSSDSLEKCCGNSFNRRVTTADRGHFHAPIPTVTFTPSESPPSSPTLRTSHRTFAASDGCCSDKNEGVFGCGEETGVWEKRTADNRKRSQEGTTSKQIHIEFSGPLNCLVAQDFVERLLFDANARLQSVFSANHLYSSLDRGETMSTTMVPMSLMRHIRQPSGLKGMRNLIKDSSTQAEKERKKLLARTQLSRNRAHQKRWYSEVDIWSACVPFVRISVITDFPLPPDNVVHGVRAQGVYSTQLCVRSAQLVVQQTLPPARAARQDETKAFSVSATCSSLAVITQIEHEPLLRSDNPSVRIPGIEHDEKDTLGVLYFTSFCGRMRHQNTQGIQNGIYHMCIDTIAFHVTRDLFFYIRSAIALWKRLESVWCAQECPRWYHARPSAETWSSHNDENTVHEVQDGVQILPTSPLTQSEHLHTPAAATERNYGIEGNRVFQGVGSIRLVRLELLDVYREGHYMHVDARHPSVVEVNCAKTKFAVRVPVKRTAESVSIPPRALATQNSSATLSSSEMCTGFGSGPEWHRRSPQLSAVQIQFIGDVDNVVVRCFPSLIHAVGTLKACEGGAASPMEIIPDSRDSRNTSNERGSPEVERGFSPQLLVDSVRNYSQVTFRGSFALGKVDLCVIQSEMNFLQVKGSGFAGFGERRAEALNSRECVKTHTLTETFSERVTRRLRAWAERARATAPKGYYPLPPSVTPQLHMKNSVFFAAETVQAQYVADVIAPCTDGFDVFEYEEGSEKLHRQDPRVFVATTKQLRVDMHHAEQDGTLANNGGCEKGFTGGERTSDSSERDEQLNMQVDVGSVLLFLPYRPKASEIVQPQLQQWVHGWLGPSLLHTVRTSEAVLDGTHRFGVKPPHKIYAGCCSLRVRDMLLRSDLPQNMTSELTIPLASLFINASSEGRVSLKAHLHPTKLSSFSPTSGRHAMNLPNIFFVYNGDHLRRSGMCLMDTVEVTMSPIIVSHMLFIFNRVTSVRSSFEKIFRPGDAKQADSQQCAGILNSGDDPGRKSNFTFLVEGLRISYLTSMTNMRFSVWRLKGRQYTTEDGELSKSHMALTVANVQVALVDRDDYDQLQTFLCESEYLQKRGVNPNGRSSKETLASPVFSNSHDQEPKRAINTLNGFIWGLFETSLTLSTGRSDTNELHSALKSIAASSSTRPSVDLRGLGNVGNTATSWNMSIYSPLLIARVGLVQLLQQSVDEAKELADEMRRAAKREGRIFHRELAKSAVYQRLTRLERRESEQILTSQRQQVERLIELTNQVMPGTAVASQRRASLALSPEPDCDDVVEGSLFQTTSDHKFFVTMTNFLAVVPFGDAPYRSILEGATDATHRRYTGEELLNRKDFIPTMAMKVKVENTSFVCRTLMSRQRVPLLATRSPSGARNEGFSALLSTTDSVTGMRQLFTSKFVLSDAHFYCSDGSPLERGATAKDVLSGTHILGGLGTLTSPRKEEYRSSLSKVSFSSIEIPLHINRSGRNVSIGSVMDMSAPQISVSTQFVSILSLFTNEISTRSLSAAFRHHGAGLGVKPKAAAVIAKAYALQTATNAAERRKREKGKKTTHVDPENILVGVAQQSEATSTLYNFDITARLEAGEMHVYSAHKSVADTAAPPPQPLRHAAAKKHRTSKRRVKFKPSLAGGEGESSNSSQVPSDLAAKKNMSVLLKIPLPEVTAMITGSYGGDVSDEERLIARVDIRENTIEIDPSIISLAHEIEQWEVVQARESAQHVGNALKLVKGWERDEGARDLTCYSTIADVALPLPRAFLSVLTNMELVSKGNAPHPGAEHHGNIHQRGTFSTRPRRERAAAPVNRTDEKQTLLSIQIRVTEFRLVLTTEPASNVSVTMALDDRVGSADFFVKRIRTQSTTWVEDSPAHPPPAILLLLCVRRLRVECQARMEVKSMEMYLQETEVQAVLQHHNNRLSLTNIYVHLPRDVSNGGKMELTVRAPYVSQMFIFQALWQRSLLESLNSINRIFDRGAAIFTEKMKATPHAQRCVDDKNPEQKSLIIVLTGSHGNVRVDLGSGNTHLVSVASMNLLLVIAQLTAENVQKICIDSSVRGVMLRSEGVLSGVARVDTVYMKGFSLATNGDQAKVIRSPGGRTFRYMICAQKLHAVFKERQLRDLLELQVGEMSLNFMDSVGEGELAANVRVDASFSRSNVVITPSTAPTFVRTVSDWSGIVAGQRAVAKMKLAHLGTGLGDVSPEEEKRSTSVGERCDSSEGAGTFGIEAVGSCERRLHLRDDLCTVPLPTDLQREARGESKDETSGGSNSDSEGVTYVPFMGNKLTHIPCGCIEVVLDRFSLLLGSASGGVEKSGCIVANFPHATLSFAECLGEEGTVVKRVLQINTDNMELYRPGPTKVLILGFHGANKCEFYTCQKIGSYEVGYVMALHQVNPWTGNPGLQDFQELIQLVRSFKATSRSRPLQRFGGIDDMWHRAESSRPLTPIGADGVTGVAPADSAAVAGQEEGAQGGSFEGSSAPASGLVLYAAASSSELSPKKHKKHVDRRYMKPLRNVQFAPQLRFGGAVAVNVDVILNWFGITKNMLPHIIHTKACDVLEGVLYFLTQFVGKHMKEIKKH